MAKKKINGPESSRRPYMPFWYQRWRSDPWVRTMSPAERGVYIEMMVACMDHREIPSDPREFHVRYSSGTGKVWMKATVRYWSGLLHHFSETRPGFICNKRVLKDLLDVGEAKNQPQGPAEERRGEERNSESFSNARENGETNGVEEDAEVARKAAVARRRKPPEPEPVGSEWRNRIAGLKAAVHRNGNGAATPRGPEGSSRRTNGSP